jgi:hypothetical protein
VPRDRRTANRISYNDPVVDIDRVNALLESFSGYSPALPPVINSFILQLFRGATDPQRPVSGSERQTLEVNFETTLTVLHQFAQNSPHDRAVALVQSIAATQTPFGLYLRSFELGARPASDRMPIEAGQSAGKFEQYFVINMDDYNLQATIQRRIAPIVPVLGVENDTFDFHVENDLPRLRLSSVIWPYIVRKLADSAALIIVYLQRLTPGIEVELSMLRQAGRQSRTIVVTNADADIQGALGDFPVAFEWSESGEQALVDAVEAMRPFSNSMSLELDSQVLPRRPILPFVREGADALVDLALTEAGREIQMRGSSVVAYDALVAAIAASFWSGNALVRSVAYKRLAMLQLEQHRLNHARSNLERFLDVVEAGDRDSGRNLGPVLAGLEPLVEVLKARDGGDSSVIRFERLQNAATE